MAIVLNGTTGITAPDIDVTAQSTDIVTTGDISAVDATLSGGVFLGGTGAANYLDDYEFGDWSPTFFMQGDSAIDTDGTCLYQKIGRTVHIWGVLRFEDTSYNPGSTNYLRLSNFPFAPSTYSGNISSGVGTAVVRYTESGDHVAFILDIGTTTGYIFNSQTGAGASAGAYVDAGSRIHFHATYYTTS